MRKPSSLIYLDHAATSYPKPPAVWKSMQTCMTICGGNPGRGAHRLSLAASQELYRCRKLAADFFAASPERIIFTLNTTHALNIVLKGLLGRGGHALCSDMEHNAVFRPLYRLAEEGVASYDVFDTFPLDPARTDEQILRSLSSRLRPETRVVVCAHTSNICSSTLPISRIGAFCRRRGLYFVVDGAQSAGHLPIDMEAMHIDALCVPGHKGLLGPQGTGMLILGSRLADPDKVLFGTLMEGGNGIDSLSGSMSYDLPERYEAGTPATPSIAGLAAGLSFVKERGLACIHETECRLTERLKNGLADIPGMHVYAPHHTGSVVLFSLLGHDSEAIARYLDENGIAVRPGFHCAALAHQTLSTVSGGAVRASVGWCTEEREIDRFLHVMHRYGKHP